MGSLVPTLVLIVVALIGARVSFSSEWAPPGPRLMFRTGTHFLLVGFALGPVGLGLLTPQATAGLFPFLALGLGWVGFHFGLQLDRESLALFPKSFFVFAVGQALLTFLLFGAGALAIALAAGFDQQLVPLLILGAACTAAVTTPAAIAMVSSNFLVRGNVRALLFFCASLDAVVGIVALQVTYSMYRPESSLIGPGTIADLRWIGAALGLGVVCGIVFIWLARAKPASEELVLYMLGICAFAAGAALQWGLSPLFVAVTMGAVVANFGTSKRRVHSLLTRWERMVYVTFLLLAGALLQVPTWIVVPLAAGYALLRLAAKMVAGALMAKIVPFRFEVPRRIGIGLIPQGGISIAMAVSGVLMYSDLQLLGIDAQAALFSVIVIGVVLSELAGPFLTMRLLTRAGEISPQVVEALAQGDERRAQREARLHMGGSRDDGADDR